ncbi:unnamed protein product, partial [Brassica rapa]
QPTWAKITRTVHGKGQRADPRGPKSPKQFTGRASVLSPRTNVLISTDVLCVLTDTHRRPVCADGHPRTSSTYVLCVLNRQPTWAKITRTVNGKGQRAESKDQRAAGRASVLSPGTNVLIYRHTRPATDVMCVRMDSHRQPRTSCLCWRTPTDVLCVLNRQPTWAKITQTVHRKGQRAESRDQRANICTDGQPWTS